MTMVWIQSLRTLCLGLLVLLAGNVALVGCAGVGQRADVEEAENLKGGENRGDDDEDDRNQKSKDGDDDEKDDD